VRAAIDENPPESEIWNSYVLVPLCSEATLVTIRVGRKVSSATPSAGDVSDGVSLEVAGAVGELLPPQAAGTKATAVDSRTAGKRGDLR
jgi:hypothetical protein